MAKKHKLAWSPVRDLMKSVGAQVVARDAVDAMITFLEETAKKVVGDALKLTRHSKRIKLTRDDIELVLKM